jgi:hypothetical protein
VPNDLPDWTPPGNPVLIDSALGVLPGTPVTHTGIKVPTATQTIVVVGTDQTFFAGGGHVDLTGEVTHQTYGGSEVFETSPSTIPIDGVLYFRYIPQDTTLSAVYDATDAVNVNFWMFAFPTAAAMTVMNTIRTVLEDSLGDLVYASAEAGTSPVVGVSLSQASPAPWQVPDYVAAGTVAVTGGTDFTLLAATTGKSWRVFDCLFDTNSGSIVVLELWDGPSASGTKIGEAIQASQNNRPMRVNLGGAKLTSGKALVGKCTFIAVGSSLFYTIPRSLVTP